MTRPARAKQAESREPRLMTAGEAAAYLALTQSGFADWRSRGLIPGPLPGTSRYDRRAIDAALDKHSGLKPDAPQSPLDMWKAGQDGRHAG